MEREKGIYDYDVEADEKIDIRRAVNKLCRDKDWNILMLQLSDLTLEDIFLRITMGDAALGKTMAGEKKPAKKISLNVENGELVAAEEKETTESSSDDNKGGEE